MTKKLSVGSMFAGIGGICLAFKQVENVIAWANENDKHACITYKYNFPNTKLFECDVHSLNTNEVPKVDIITAGFPCQAFSIAGYREGFHDKKGRGNLFFQTARFIKELKPNAFLLENVRNLSGHDRGNTLRVIRNTIVNELNYSFIPFILNSKDFGNIPQTRERIYIVGFRNEGKYSIDDKLKLPKILTHYFKIPKPIPLMKSIHDILFKDKQNDKFYYKENHKYYPILKNEVRSRDTVYQWRRVYVRENKNSVCPTLTANMGTGGHNVPIILDSYGIRKLTPDECLRFQGFPPEFTFPHNIAQSHLYKQAGNSVVVTVVQRIAKEVNRVLFLREEMKLLSFERKNILEKQINEYNSKNY